MGSEADQRQAVGAANDVPGFGCAAALSDRDEWRPYVNAYRPMCLAPSADFDRVLDNVCKLWRRVMVDPQVEGAGNSNLPPSLWPDGLVVADAFQPSLHAAGRLRLIQKRDMPAVRHFNIKHVRTASPHFLRRGPA